jgi:cell wall-associated NlpC family hydrolase
VPNRYRARVTHTLPRLVAALSVLAAAVTVGASTAAGKPGPANPAKAHSKHVDPDLAHRIGAVNAQLDRLSRQNDQLDEQYNVAAAAVTAAQRTAKRAQQAAGRASASYQVAHAQFLQAITQQYEGGPSASVGKLLSSDAPQQYLDALTMDSYLADQFAGTVDAEQALRADAATATRRAVAALAAARTKEAALAKKRAALHAQADRFKQLLDNLTAQQQRELAHAREVAAAAAQAALGPQRSAVRTTTTRAAPRTFAGPVSGSVARVIAFAEAQVGKYYSYGASGPDAYDCSGLTMASWAQAGVQLPHSSAEQYNYGTHVAYSQLQPGDLIFLYSPIGHVELYVGHDLAVSAANPATGIVYVHPSQDMADYVGATRLTG